MVPDHVAPTGRDASEVFDPKAFNIFISYRRGDDEDGAGRLDDRLRRDFGGKVVYRDRTAIGGGDFVDQLESAIAGCEVLITVIGKDWLAQMEDEKLFDERDWIRREIKAAIDHGLTIMPVFIGGVSPGQLDVHKLPESLSSLPRQHAVSLDRNNYEASYASLVQLLRKAEADWLVDTGLGNAEQAAPQIVASADGPWSALLAHGLLLFEATTDGVSARSLVAGGASKTCWLAGMSVAELALTQDGTGLAAELDGRLAIADVAPDAELVPWRKPVDIRDPELRLLAARRNGPSVELLLACTEFTRIVRVDRDGEECWTDVGLSASTAGAADECGFVLVGENGRLDHSHAVPSFFDSRASELLEGGWSSVDIATSRNTTLFAGVRRTGDGDALVVIRGVGEAAPPTWSVRGVQLAKIGQAAQRVGVLKTPFPRQEPDLVLAQVEDQLLGWRWDGLPDMA